MQPLSSAGRQKIPLKWPKTACKMRHAHTAKENIKLELSNEEIPA